VRDGAPGGAPDAREVRSRWIIEPFATGHRYDTAADLRGFVEQHRAALDDPQTAYYVSQALEECAALRPPPGDRETRWIELAASAALSQPCRGFDGTVIQPGEIVELLGAAARRGEPHAIARMLLFRDIAAPKSDVMADIPKLLATRDPAVVRDVGAFLSKGEAVWRYGTEQVPAPAAAIAWELAACDLGYACGPASRLVLSLCAFERRCDAGHYEEALMRYEPPELMADAQRLRIGILRALRDSDWEWLGIDE
jgi:hypothetical protein